MCTQILVTTKMQTFTLTKPTNLKTRLEIKRISLSINFGSPDDQLDKYQQQMIQKGGPVDVQSDIASK
jgi:hypothetical protein